MLLGCVAVFGVSSAAGQTSSLYVPAVAGGAGGEVLLSSRGASFASVSIPEPRQFGINDLLTIIIRESVESDSKANMDTEKKVDMQGEIAEFPDLQLRDLLQFRVKPGDTEGDRPTVDLSYNGKFEGDGDYKRKDTFTARITARVIDIKPNGTMVVEARKFVKSDDESLNIVLTGTCRREDVTSDNTVLSTQMYDLNLVKEHEGELRRATQKGWLTGLFEWLVPF
jgi:flagellar L-ring protein precursor FlgH